MCNKRYFLWVLLLLILGMGLSGSDWLTVAERTNYEKTSTYNDVIDFVFEAQKRSPMVRVARLATSTEGRMVPMVIVSKEGIAAPWELRALGKPAVLINANIHAGEIEGKEATLMLLREIVTEEFAGILENQVILVIPIFNADGNDKLDSKNRRDNGPELAGVRHNGQHLDLNRDAIKLESPEMKALIKTIIDWDPVLFVDMHTTNGSYHREPVTYNTMLNPNSDPLLIDYMWKKMFPAVAETLKKKYRYDSLPYGNFVDRAQPEKGWYSHAWNARYGTNYVGLRNRFTILDENYAHADFKTRVLSAFGFIKAILLYTGQHIDEMQKMINTADMKTREEYYKQPFALEIKNEKLMELDIKSYEFSVEKIKPEDLHKYPPWYHGVLVKKTDVHKDYHVDYLANPVPTRTVSLPQAYVILPHHDEIIEILEHHGIVVERIRKPVKTTVENFVLKKIKPVNRIFQGHIFLDVEGKYEEKEVTIPAGSYFVSMKQSLARVIPVLLEPECDDSLLRWGFLNREIVQQWTGRPRSYPVYRLKKADIPMEKYSE